MNFSIVIRKLQSFVNVIIKKVSVFLLNNIHFFIIRPRQITKATILLIRLDAIGDYILFRNFIEVLKKDEKYRSHAITFVGNEAWRDLSTELDGKYISEFIWINRTQFVTDFKYKYSILKKVSSKGYEIILSPVFSREYFVDNDFVKFIRAKHKIGSYGNYTNISKDDKQKTDKYYTQLVPFQKGILFEFSRNLEFFEWFLQKRITLEKTSISLEYIRDNTTFHLKEEYVVFFIGASTNQRKWHISGFIEVANFLTKNYSFQIILCGATNDVESAKYFENHFNGECVNLVGKTNLKELIAVVSKATVLISNETSVPHIAVALNVKNVFVIYNGINYGRFVPYPAKMSENYHVIYHPEIDKNLNDYMEKSNQRNFFANLNMQEIKAETVIEKIRNSLINEKDLQ